VPGDGRGHARARRRRHHRRLSGAYHYFDVEGQRLEVLAGVENDNRPGGMGATVSYQAEAAGDAYRRVEEFLGRHLR
jgi:dienelactone hydrolase